MYVAGVRKPRTDEQLAADERAMLIEQLQQDHIDLAAEAQAKLADAGEPEAQSAISALRAVTRGNITRLTQEQLDAVGMADTATAATGEVQDERISQVRAQQVEERKKHEANKGLSAKERARALMRNHWQRWAHDGDKNYSKACSSFRLNVGRDAVALVDGGVFDSHLDVAQFIMRMSPTRVEAQETDWTDDMERELKELRGEE